MLEICQITRRDLTFKILKRSGFGYGSGQIRASKRGYRNDSLVVELVLAQWSWPANGHPYLPLATKKEAWFGYLRPMPIAPRPSRQWRRLFRLFIMGCTRLTTKHALLHAQQWPPACIPAVKPSNTPRRGAQFRATAPFQLRPRFI